MSNVNRREFLKTTGLISLGALPLMGLLTSCSPESKEKAAKNFSILTVSSDPYKTDLTQRLAFAIFEGSTVASAGTIPVTLESPSGKVQTFKEVQVRDKGIPQQGIYSIDTKLNESGIWNLSTTFQGKKLELPVNVAESAVAPGLATLAPTIATPTTASPLDASILCTRFEGDCGLHDHSVPDLLAQKKPFVVLFATPARCQTSYCGPVLDLTREVSKDFDLDVVHVEIYKNETTPDVLDAVKGWNLPSEPWLFGITADGKIDSRLDGAFDQSEIEESFRSLS